MARTLERAWEEALRAQRALEEEYDRFRQEQPVGLSAADRCPDRAAGAEPAGAVALAADRGGGEASGHPSAGAAGGGLGAGLEPGGEGPVALDRRHGDGAPGPPNGEVVGAGGRRPGGLEACGQGMMSQV